MLATAQTDILIVTALSLCAPSAARRKLWLVVALRFENGLFFSDDFRGFIPNPAVFFRYDRSHIRKCHALEYVERE